MSELTDILHQAGEINDDTVKIVSDFIEQNQLNTAVINSGNAVNISVQFAFLNTSYKSIIIYSFLAWIARTV